MYAIVNIAGHQFKVEKQQELFVHRLEGKEESTVSFDNVLLIDNNGKIVVGSPKIDGASVSAKILEHLKGEKVLVFKKKRRKGYQKLNGHRQLFTKIQIEKIEEKASKKIVKETAKAEPKPKAKKETAKKAPTKKAAPKAKAAEKKPAKKAAAKKPTAKKDK